MNINGINIGPKGEKAFKNWNKKGTLTINLYKNGKLLRLNIQIRDGKPTAYWDGELAQTKQFRPEMPPGGITYDSDAIKEWMETYPNPMDYYKDQLRYAPLTGNRYMAPKPVELPDVVVTPEGVMAPDGSIFRFSKKLTPESAPIPETEYNFMTAIGQTISPVMDWFNSNVMMNKDGIRVKNAQNHNRVMNLIKEGGDDTATILLYGLATIVSGGTLGSMIATDGALVGGLEALSSLLGAEGGKKLVDELVYNYTDYDNFSQMVNEITKHGVPTAIADLMHPGTLAGGMAGYKGSRVTMGANGKITVTKGTTFDDYVAAVSRPGKPSSLGGYRFVEIDPMTGEAYYPEVTKQIMVPKSSPIPPERGGVVIRRYSGGGNRDAAGTGHGEGRYSRGRTHSGATTSSLGAPARMEEITVGDPREVVVTPTEPTYIYPEGWSPYTVIPTVLPLPRYAPIIIGPPPAEEEDERLEEVVPKNGWGWYSWYAMLPEGTVQYWRGDNDTPANYYLINRSQPDIWVRRVAPIENTETVLHKGESKVKVSGRAAKDSTSVTAGYHPELTPGARILKGMVVGNPELDSEHIIEVIKERDRF